MTTTPPLQSKRFRLDNPTLAAALDRAGLEPTHRSGLPGDLPTTDASASLLEDAGLLDADGNLRAELETALGICADPAQTLVIVQHRAGSRTLDEIEILQPAGGDAYVAQSVTEDGVELSYFPTRTTALLALDSQLQLTTLPAGADREPLELDLRGLAAFAAACDLHQRESLAARLERARRPLPLLTADALVALLDDGLRSPDTRWAVSALQLTAPVSFEEARDQLGDGLDQLGDAGLLDRQDGGYRFTEDGFAGAMGFARLLDTAALSVAADHGGDRLSVARWSLLRHLDGIWIVGWKRPQGADTGLVLEEVSARTALHFLRSLLDRVSDEDLPELSPRAAQAEPVESSGDAANRFCTQCGTPLVPEAKFCTECGAPIE